MKTSWSQQTAPISYFMTALDSGCDALSCLHTGGFLSSEDYAPPFNNFYLFIFIVLGDVRLLTDSSQDCSYFHSWQLRAVAWIHSLIFHTALNPESVCVCVCVTSIHLCRVARSITQKRKTHGKIQLGKK